MWFGLSWIWAIFVRWETYGKLAGNMELENIQKDYLPQITIDCVQQGGLAGQDSGQGG